MNGYRSRKTQSYLRSIAANIVARRRLVPLTQEKLAEQAHLDITYLQRIERAKVNMSVDVIVAIADALHIEPPCLWHEAELEEAKAGRPRKGPSSG